jgi:hypothetical protein
MVRPRLDRSDRFAKRRLRGTLIKGVLVAAVFTAVDYVVNGKHGNEYSRFGATVSAFLMIGVLIYALLLDRNAGLPVTRHGLMKNEKIGIDPRSSAQISGKVLTHGPNNIP